MSLWLAKVMPYNDNWALKIIYFLKKVIDLNNLELAEKKNKSFNINLFLHIFFNYSVFF